MAQIQCFYKIFTHQVLEYADINLSGDIGDEDVKDLMKTEAEDIIRQIEELKVIKKSNEAALEIVKNFK